MMPHQSRTENLILRREAFGGTIFHTMDATFIDLDRDGFTCAANWLIDGKPPVNDEERLFREELGEKLPSIATEARLVQFTEPEPDTLPGQLNSPTLVDFQITERCNAGCPHCYVSSTPNAGDVSWEDARYAIDEIHAAGVCQVAIGGGDPLLHPKFADLLAYIRDRGMVPNVTTTALDISKVQRTALARHCGAVAVSLEAVGDRFADWRGYGFDRFRQTVDLLLEDRNNLVFQVVLSERNIDDLDAIVEFCLGVKPLYGVIFLAFKPVGRGEVFDRPLSVLPPELVHKKVLRALHALYPYTRVGYDCCLAPCLVSMEEAMGYERGTVVEGCSACRSSLGLTLDLQVVPCTFLPDVRLGNLREKSLIDIWRSHRASAFRGAIKSHADANEKCRACDAQNHCLGGCQAFDLVSCVKGKQE